MYATTGQQLRAGQAVQQAQGQQVNCADEVLLKWGHQLRFMNNSRAAGQVGAGPCRGAEGQQVDSAAKVLVQRCHQLNFMKNSSRAAAGQQDRLVQGHAGG
jgi:hypothetical protein